MIRGKKLKEIKVMKDLPLLCVEPGKNFTIGEHYSMGNNTLYLKGDDGALQLMSRNEARFLPVAPSEVV